MAELPPESDELEGLKASFHRMIRSLPEPYCEAICVKPCAKDGESGLAI
jgi:hypothetical protein